MQVLKRLTIFFLVIALLGCKSRLTDNRIEISNYKYDIIDFEVTKVLLEQYSDNDLFIFNGLSDEKDYVKKN